MWLTKVSTCCLEEFCRSTELCMSLYSKTKGQNFDCLHHFIPLHQGNYICPVHWAICPWIITFHLSSLLSPSTACHHSPESCPHCMTKFPYPKEVCDQLNENIGTNKYSGSRPIIRLVFLCSPFQILLSLMHLIKYFCCLVFLPLHHIIAVSIRGRFLSIICQTKNLVSHKIQPTNCTSIRISECTKLSDISYHILLLYP